MLNAPKKSGQETVGQRSGRNTSLTGVAVTEFNINRPHARAHGHTLQHVIDALREDSVVLEARGTDGGTNINVLVGIEPTGLATFPKVAQDIADRLDLLARKVHLEWVDRPITY